jgi:adenylate kinase family enzyme
MATCVKFYPQYLTSPRIYHYMSRGSGHLLLVGSGSEFSWPVRQLLHQELDSLHYGPDWVKRRDFESDVQRFSAQTRWVTEDQYHRLLGNLLWERANTVIWLDLPRRTVMWRVVRRSLRRASTRAELWNGNRERWRDWLQPDHPIRWAWLQFSRHRTQTTERPKN